MFKYKLQFLNEDISKKFARKAVGYHLKILGSTVIISGKYEDEFDVISYACRYKGYFISLTDREKRMKI